MLRLVRLSWLRAMAVARAPSTVIPRGLVSGTTVGVLVWPSAASGVFHQLAVWLGWPFSCHGGARFAGGGMAPQHHDMVRRPGWLAVVKALLARRLASEIL